MNNGVIMGKTYVKHVDFSKAVLWKTKSLSIPPHIFEQLRKEGVEYLKYVGIGNNKETWVFSFSDIDDQKVLTSFGQEPQYYFSIQLKRINKEAGVRT